MEYQTIQSHVGRMHRLLRMSQDIHHQILNLQPVEMDICIQLFQVHQVFQLIQAMEIDSPIHRAVETEIQAHQIHTIHITEIEIEIHTVIAIQAAIVILTVFAIQAVIAILTVIVIQTVIVTHTVAEIHMMTKTKIHHQAHLIVF